MSFFDLDDGVEEGRSSFWGFGWEGNAVGEEVGEEAH